MIYFTNEFIFEYNKYKIYKYINIKVVAKKKVALNKTTFNKLLRIYIT